MLYWLRRGFTGILNSYREFSKRLILIDHHDKDVLISKEANTLLDSWGGFWIDGEGLSVRPGPYFYQDNTLYEVMRLYDDEQGAFMISVKPDVQERGKFEIMNDGKHGWYVYFSILIIPCPLDSCSVIFSFSIDQSTKADWEIMLGRDVLWRFHHVYTGSPLLRNPLPAGV